YCSAEEVARNAKCLLGHVEKVRRVLWRKGFSEHAIEQAITAVYQATMPYITGTKLCLIENRRALGVRVAVRAARHAAMREVRCCPFEPTILASTIADRECCEVLDSQPREVLFDYREALSHLTQQQRTAVKLCLIAGLSLRQAAKNMGI